MKKNRIGAACGGMTLWENSFTSRRVYLNQPGNNIQNDDAQGTEFTGKTGGLFSGLCTTRLCGFYNLNFPKK